jgi:hypothetical protein
LVIKYNDMVSDASRQQMSNIILQSAVGTVDATATDRTQRFDISRRRGKGNENGEGEIERVAFDRNSESQFATHREGSKEVGFQRGFKLDIKPTQTGHVVVPDTKMRAVNSTNVLKYIDDWCRDADKDRVDRYDFIMDKINPKFRPDGAFLCVVSCLLMF